MIPTFYQTHLKSQFSLADYIFLKILITLLQSIKKVKLETLATVLPIPIIFESRRKKIQRFLSLPNLTIEKTWFPIVTAWLETNFTCEKIIYVVIDRTNWAGVNLFMVSVVWDKRAFPVYFELLPKLGSSNLKEYGRIQKRHSSFYIGLYGQHWVNFMEQCKDLVTDLMKLSRNKRPFYQRGLRAMELILSAS
ncbi:MAG: hypothetical protein KME28_04900 [Pelatocladus maniniholoensis HA4357-MV3]|jgi:hypothetical protein|uniref:Transposase n=1 Tax=Pelatocladus maniniholoensis HA4357-MV3 TaxID=1117104 RepID=A0A9E3H6J2_9NOST|nr:hypothetical protein [Pelatocladus maniniholoensis HA4357-MV3]BAZ68094.1 transposase [Fischerella sp. NIES-4106]